MRRGIRIAFEWIGNGLPALVTFSVKVGRKRLGRFLRLLDTDANNISTSMFEKPLPVEMRERVGCGAREAAGDHYRNDVPVVAVSSCPLGGTKLRTLIVLLSCLWSVTSTLNATSTWPPAWPGTKLYCSPNGSGSGTSTNSPCSVSYGLSHTTSGNTLVFMDGDYNGEISVGTSGITLGALHKWKARIRNPNGGSFTSGISVYPNGTHNVTLDGFYVTDCPANGISLFGPSNTVRNCWVTHCATGGYNGPPNWGGGYGIYGKSQDYNVVDKCLVEYCGSVPSYDQAIYVGGKGVEVRNNVVRYNAAFGIQLNVFSGIVDQCKVYNNLCYSNAVLGGNAYEFAIDSDSSTGAGINYFYGNTFLSRSGTASYINNAVVCLTNNIIRGVNYTGSYGSVRSGNNLNNPASSNFVNPAKGLFWLTSGSSARGAAKTSICGPADFFGTTQSSVSDIGAFQYNGAYTTDSRVLGPSVAYPDYWLSLTATINPEPPQNLRVVQR